MGQRKKLFRSEAISQVPSSLLSPKQSQKAATFEVKVAKGYSFGNSYDPNQIPVENMSGSRAGDVLSTREVGTK